MNQKEWQQLKAKFASQHNGMATLAIISTDCILFVAAFHLNRGGGWTALISIPILALVLVHAYLLLHEASHSAISRKPVFNDIVGHVTGWLILMPFLTRKRSHLLHHIWCGHPKGDPTNARVVERFKIMTPRDASRLERIWKSWLPLLTLNDRIGMWADPFRQRKAGLASSRFGIEIRSSCLYIISYAILIAILIWSHNLGAFCRWYLPAWFLQLLMEELANLPHHAETPLLKETDKALPYWEQDCVTHSCRTLPVWSSFVLLNFNLHTAHHLFPSIPWSGLPEVHRELLGRLPAMHADQQTRNELEWSIRNRKRPLLEIMGHYFRRSSVTGE